MICFQNLKVHAVNKENFEQFIKNKSLVENEDSHDYFLQEFDDFNSSAVKNHHLTIQEMFAKQLMQIAGLTQGMARVIVDNVRLD